MEVFLILGSPGSGRRQILADLVEGGYEEDDAVSVAIIRSEAAEAASEVLHAFANLSLLPYDELPSLPPPADASALFILVAGNAEPADSIEAVQRFLKQNRLELTRIIAVIDCALAEREAHLVPWFDCCIHFADVVLLNHREKVSPKWMRDFQKRYRDQHLPCLFENVKKGRVSNPALVLDPTPRRASLIFDDIDAVDQIVFDPDNLPDAPIDLVAPPDPWLERLPSGQRARPVPKLPL